MSAPITGVSAVATSSDPTAAPASDSVCNDALISDLTGDVMGDVMAHSSLKAAGAALARQSVLQANFQSGCTFSGTETAPSFCIVAFSDGKIRIELKRPQGHAPARAMSRRGIEPATSPGGCSIIGESSRLHYYSVSEIRIISATP
jgi:hypothetical protein